MSSIVSINGKTYYGNSISVSKGKVIIDGQNVTPEDTKIINISVEGNIEELKVDYCEKITIKGNAKNITTQSGDIELSGNIEGGVQTMSGDIECGNIGGGVNTMSGDIKYRKS